MLSVVIQILTIHAECELSRWYVDDVVSVFLQFLNVYYPWIVGK